MPKFCNLYKKMSKEDTMEILEKYGYPIEDIKGHIYDDFVSKPTYENINYLDWFYDDNDVYIDQSKIMNRKISDIIGYLKTIDKDAELRPGYDGDVYCTKYGPETEKAYADRCYKLLKDAYDAYCYRKKRIELFKKIENGMQVQKSNLDIVMNKEFKNEDEKKKAIDKINQNLVNLKVTYQLMKKEISKYINE